MSVSVGNAEVANNDKYSHGLFPKLTELPDSVRFPNLRTRECVMKEWPVIRP